MPGKCLRLNPLESRKRLLVAESDLNRVQLQEEWRAMADGVRGLAGRAQTVGSLASAAALVLAGVSAFRRTPAAPADAKPSWLQTALKGAQLAGSLWLALRARPR